jgi:hypothetical protein
MKQTPVFITEYGLARLLKQFAQELGLSETLSDVNAQAFMQLVSKHEEWSEFIANNCFRCVKAPGSCDFFNPKPENCIEGATPENVKAANAMVIERGTLTDCPSRLDPEDSRIRDRQAQDSPAEGEADEQA